MIDAPNNDLDPNSSRTLVRYGRLQRINVIAFYLAFIGVLGGFAIGCSGLETLGVIAIVIGFAIVGLLCVEKALIIPFLKCPFCRSPFFVPKGWIGILHKINPHHRSCVNCGINIDAAQK